MMLLPISLLAAPSLEWISGQPMRCVVMWKRESAMLRALEQTAHAPSNVKGTTLKTRDESWRAKAKGGRKHSEDVIRSFSQAVERINSRFGLVVTQKSARLD